MLSSVPVFPPNKEHCVNSVPVSQRKDRMASTSPLDRHHSHMCSANTQDNIAFFYLQCRTTERIDPMCGVHLCRPRENNTIYSGVKKMAEAGLYASGKACQMHSGDCIRRFRYREAMLSEAIVQAAIVSGERKVTTMSKCRVTSKGVARKASKALSDGRSSPRTKSVAGSALAQRQKKRH